MAVKTTDRPLMRQKINVTPVLIKKWVDTYKYDIRQVIHGSLLEVDDIGTKFTHQEREFEIVGMGEGRSLMLRETRTEGEFYWECTRQFVQMSLERYNREFVKLPNGKTILRDMAYETPQLHLAPKSVKRRKPVVEEVEEPIIPLTGEIILNEYEEETEEEEDQEQEKEATDESIF